MEYILYVGLAAAAVSFTISSTAIFQKFRNFVESKSEWLSDLVHCPWCLNHYVVLFFMLIQPDSEWNNVGDFITHWFSSVCVALPIHYIALRAYKPVIKAGIERDLQRFRSKQIENGN